METEQASSTFKHFPVFPAPEGGKTCGEQERAALEGPAEGASLTRLSRWMERASLIIYTLLMKRVTLNLLQTRYTHETLVQGKGKLIR